jgi:hypothetical protein
MLIYRRCGEVEPAAAAAAAAVGNPPAAVRTVVMGEEEGLRRLRRLATVGQRAVRMRVALAGDGIQMPAAAACEVCGGVHMPQCGALRLGYGV